MSVQSIPVADVQRELGGGRPLIIVDVRTPAEFSGVHAVGARSMPLDVLAPATLASWRQSSDQPIYIICQSGSRAAAACRQLEDAGVESVFSIDGGMNAWQRMGLPVERGQTGVISLERQVRITAGLLVFIGSLLAWLVHPLLLIVPAFVGAGLTFAGLTDTCGMGMLLSRMPWNRRASPACAGRSC